MTKKIKEIVEIHIILIILIAIFFYLDIRICLFYNIFHIPCAGCGISRGIINLLKGDIITAIRYNFLSVIIVVTYIILLIWFVIDIIMKKETLQIFINKNRKKIIIIASILTILAWITNLNNPILY